MKKLIVTVCWGNMLRSVFLKLRLDQELAAHALSERYEVLSRGVMGSGGVEEVKQKNITKYPLWKHCESRFRAHGVEIPPTQQSTPVDRLIVERASIILAADRKVLRDHFASLHQQFPDLDYKMLLFSELIGETYDVDDCNEDDTEENAERCIATINGIAANGFGRLIALLNK